MLAAVRYLSLTVGRRGFATRPVELTKSGVVELRFGDLVEGKDLTQHIEKAYGPDGLGILVVSGVPGFAEKRKRLLPLGRKFSDLPKEDLASMEHAPSHFSVGWSHGKEKFNGVADTAKGSFYANPQYNHPSENLSDHEKHPEYCLPNIWPRTQLPELEHTFRDLGQLMVSVGGMVAQQCDIYVKKHVPTYQSNKLTNTIASSLTCKARLLHYFPIQGEEAAKLAAQDSWCGWHLDHGSLTGLTPAMFVDEQYREVPNPDPESGLYIRDRAGKQHKVAFAGDQIAFQIGESSQIHTGGLLVATPHCVRASSKGGNVSRDTFAVFMQPNIDSEMDIPAGVDPKKIDIKEWKKGMNFDQFSVAKFASYY